MATYTDKLNLKKPESTDFYNIEDFNENFEKIDDYADNFRLKTFTDLTQIGLTLGSETIEAIARALPENSMLFISVGSASNKEIYPAYTSGARYGVLRVTKKFTERVLFEYFYLPDANSKYTRYWSGLFSTTWYGWVESITEQGGTLVGDLRIKKTSPRIQMNDSSNSRYGVFEIGSEGYVSIGNWRDATDQTNLQIRQPSDGLEEAIRLTVNGTNTYRLFGEHNKEALNLAKVFVGSYEGAGTHGSNAPCKIILPFKPKYVFVEAYYVDTDHLTSANFFYGHEVNYAHYWRDSSTGTGATYELITTWGDNYLEWYNTNSDKGQLNNSGDVYKFIAIG